KTSGRTSSRASPMHAVSRGLLLLTLVNLQHSLEGRVTPEVANNTQSVCFNNCSGRGRCVDYACECDVGYDGDDCSFCYIEGGDVLPILSAGDVNLTSNNFHDTLHAAGAMIAIATSRSCHRCIHLETEYHSARSDLRDKVRFRVVVGRIDADVERKFLGDVLGGFDETKQRLPIIALWIATSTRKSKKAILYSGPHERHAIVEFVHKQLGPPARQLQTVAEVNDFVRSPHFQAESTLSSDVTTVVGFFSDAGDMEEDEMEDFMEAALKLKPRGDVYFAVVDDASICDHFKKLGWILRTSEAVVTRSGLLRAPSLSLWALLDNNLSVMDWIIKESVPIVGRLTNANFAQYERTKLPMLIMFLDLPGYYAPTLVSRFAGESGGVPNHDLIKELKEVALEHRGRISCVYADGVAFSDGMKTLGLFGGRDRLPQVGFNAMNGGWQLPFPEDLPINRQTLLHFTAAFLNGRLQSSVDARKAMVASRPFNTHNTVRRKKKRTPVEEVRGVSEHFKPKDAVVQASRPKHETFVQVVLESDKDVLLMFHSEDCEKCSNMVPYYKRIGERFLDLDIPSVLVAAMDVTNETPPPELPITFAALPTILLLTADDKGPPYRFFSGVGKVRPLMKWVQEHASTRFDLPVLPHLSEADKPLFREQVRERQNQHAARSANS
ncbi:unnamed protein product, partial [Laminaria digitata]